MTTDDLVELQVDSLRTLLLTRQHLVILRDPQTERGLPIRLTASEADALGPCSQGDEQTTNRALHAMLPFLASCGSPRHPVASFLCSVFHATDSSQSTW